MEGDTIDLALAAARSALQHDAADWETHPYILARMDTRVRAVRKARD
jgi:hypothetical protein